MRKIKLQMQVSLDGFVAGPHGEQDWMVWNWGEDLKNYAIELSDSVDTMLIGRVTYQEMASYWPAAAANPKSTEDETEFAKYMNNLSKVVFSKTLSTVDWQNSRLAKGSIEEEIKNLKQQSGKDIIIYGGAGIVSALIKLGLIDEYHLFINPVVIGNGMTIFKELAEQRKLKLVRTITSSVGIVVLCYHPG